MFFNISLFSQAYEEKQAKFYPVLDTSTQLNEAFFERIVYGDSCMTGASMPDFVATTVNNELIDIKALRGKVLVLDFVCT